MNKVSTTHPVDTAPPTGRRAILSFSRLPPRRKIQPKKHFRSASFRCCSFKGRAGRSRANGRCLADSAKTRKRHVRLRNARAAKETGVTDVHMEYFNVYSRPGRDPRGWIISHAFFALVQEKWLARARRFGCGRCALTSRSRRRLRWHWPSIIRKF